MDGTFSQTGQPASCAALRRTALRHDSTAYSTSQHPALVRALRAGTLDLALLASAPPFRPPDAELPPLELQTLTERDLCLAVPATHPLARGDFVDVADLRGQRWIAGSSSAEDRLMGVWPGLDERPDIAHTARDWLAELQLVAAGCGLTTAARRARLRRAGGRPRPTRQPRHRASASCTSAVARRNKRRLLLARLPHPTMEPVSRVAAALCAPALAADPPVAPSPSPGGAVSCTGRHTDASPVQQNVEGE
ncbi:LysR substrate-binding domain-containing protein [Streptomyces sp. NPDC096205]|uniref:LysR substrate-binding domain-containing protein n=1 Tax=Streptomyces sp. NPDC096205 TaxID=3366081 RepID=UPI003800A7A3